MTWRQGLLFMVLAYACGLGTAHMLERAEVARAEREATFYKWIAEEWKSIALAERQMRDRADQERARVERDLATRYEDCAACDDLYGRVHQ